MAQFVIAIDVGIKNLGLCVFDFCTSKIVHWDCVSLVPNGRYVPMNNVDYVRNFVQRYEHFFDNADKIIIERQIRCNMRIVEAVLQTMFYDKTIIISARSVKMHYDLSTKNYRANKQRAVQWAMAFTKANPQAFQDTCVHAFANKSKQDDLADSLLLVLYYLDTYSNQVSVSAWDVFIQGGLVF
jgi:hypothetical protein